MLFNVFTTAAIALLAAPALANPIETLPEGLESHLESRAGDVTARFWKQTTCKTERSKINFQSGHCIKDLAGRDHGVSMDSRKKSSCHSLNLYDCFNIGDEWKSMKFKC
ncbi:hypothetical protein F25303_6936 [Fusarium sp. NRRL 25303]|nr:hypothetical protein F25303_6936 [Fusarium sp. NRRL 25303]